MPPRLECRPCRTIRSSDATKALQTAALARGNHDFAAQWAGQGAALARELPAAELLRTLVEELRG